MVTLLTISTFIQAGLETRAAAAVRVHLRGAARLSARASRGSDGDLVISGAVVDDAGAPLSRVLVDAMISAAGGTAGSGEPARVFRPCQEDGPRDRAGAADGAQDRRARDAAAHLRTDDGGEFCFQASLLPASYVAHLSVASTALLDGAGLELAVDLQRMPLAPRFDPAPRVLHLDGPVVLRASAFVASDMAAPATGLHLDVLDERGTILSSGASDAFGHAHFTIPMRAFAGPGPGKLRLACSGEECSPGSGVTLDVERHVTVRLDPQDAELAKRAQSPEDGTALDVNVGTALGAEVNEGTVEARLGGVLVGAARVTHGTAHLVVTFRPASSGEAAIDLRYLPASPWFEPGDDAVAHLQVHAKTALRQAPLLAAGIVVVAWLVGTRLRGRARPRSRSATSPASGTERPFDVAGIELIARDAAGTRWSGRILDAHDRAAIAGAEIVVERGGFTHASILARAVADAEGRFRLPTFTRAAGDQLVAFSRLHAELRQPLPAAGDLVVQLVSRRRALLDRLVAWARQRLRDHAKLEPTPAQVRRRTNDYDVQRWADATERVAFGAEEVDASREGDVDKLAPR